MAKTDHKVTITTTDGETVTLRTTEDGARTFDDLPFTAPNVQSTQIIKE